MWISLATIVFSSCIPQKKMLYMQVTDDADTLTAFKNERKIEYLVQPGDNLYIRVVTPDEKSTFLLNPLTYGNNTNINNDASVYLNSYSVTESGYLDFPMVGEILVKNLNVEEIKLVDMHLPHLLRAYSRLIDTWDEREGYNDGWNAALESLKK